MHSFTSPAEIQVLEHLVLPVSISSRRRKTKASRRQCMVSYMGEVKIVRGEIAKFIRRRAKTVVALSALTSVVLRRDAVARACEGSQAFAEAAGGRSLETENHSRQRCYRCFRNHHGCDSSWEEFSAPHSAATIRLAYHGTLPQHLAPLANRVMGVWVWVVCVSFAIDAVVCGGSRGIERRNYEEEVARPTSPCTLPPCLRTLRQLRQLAHNNRPEEGVDLSVRQIFHYGYSWIVRSNL